MKTANVVEPITEFRTKHDTNAMMKLVKPNVNVALDQIMRRNEKQICSWRKSATVSYARIIRCTAMSR